VKGEGGAGFAEGHNNLGPSGAGAEGEAGREGGFNGSNSAR